MQKLKTTRRKQNKQKETYKKHNNSKKNITNNRNTGYPAHEPPLKINISKGLAGRCLLLSVLYVFLRVFMLFSVFICVVFDCKCKSLKRLGENNKKNERNTNNNRTTQRTT